VLQVGEACPHVAVDDKESDTLATTARKLLGKNPSACVQKCSDCSFCFRFVEDFDGRIADS
jgi:hypothetical protein